ncbi:hypothetical protein NKH48_17530 [Mesorhizobium sp. M1233]|uniref:phage late control D family protein n=1 Tax=unclassified Mesorhizobium TaxID=325217 RepID=UPI00333BB59F
MFDWAMSSAAHRQPAGCRILIDDAEITDLYPLVTDVTVNNSREIPSTARIVLAAPVDERGSWRVQDEAGIAVGAKVVIDAIFGTESDEAFRGFISQINPSYPGDRGQARVVYTCRDDTLPLDRNHACKLWENEAPTTDGAIVAQICAAHGLAPSPENGQGQAGIQPMQNSSDMAFLRERANANGYEVYVRGGFVYFGPMQLAGEPQAPILVYAGRKTNCLSFEPQEDAHNPDSISVDLAATEGDAVETITVRPDLELLGLRPATGEGSAAGANDWRFGRATTPDKNAAKILAQARVNEAAMRVTATGELDGALYGHVLQVGRTVVVDGAGFEWSGRYYVDRVAHSFSTTGYRQTFGLSRNARGDDGAAGGGVLDAILGALW